MGFDLSFSPKFVKRYAELQHPMTQATRDYVGEVRSGTFPSAEHSFHRTRPGKKVTRLY